MEGQNESQIGEEKRNGRIDGAAETSKELAQWCRLQRKNMNIMGLLRRKEWLHCHRENSWQVRQSRLSQKENKQSSQFRVPNHEKEKVEVSKSRTFARQRGISARAWKRKSGLHSEGRKIPRRKRRESNKCLPRKSRRKHKRVSGRKSSPERSAESWFHSKFGQT